VPLIPAPPVLEVPPPVLPKPAVLEMPPPVEQTPAVPEMIVPAEAPSIAELSSRAEIPPVAEPSVAEPPLALEPIFLNDAAPATPREPAPEFELDLPVEAYPAGEASAPVEPEEAAPVFNLDLLPPDAQELHRRASRVAKVSMQDIRMLRPEDVRLGLLNKDLCFRLRDDIEKAHKEYDRRFQSIQSHPVDYFYDWMVEILAGGDPQALGEYPYPSPVLRR
jgi:hypothetical protein